MKVVSKAKTVVQENLFKKDVLEPLCDLFEGLVEVQSEPEQKYYEDFFMCLLVRYSGSSSRLNKIFEISQMVQLAHSAAGEGSSFDKHTKIAIELNRKYTAELTEWKERIFEEMEKGSEE